jgi:Recombination directionality factor-like
MAILGLTHDSKGAPMQELPINLKVAIGEGPDPDNETNNPRPLFHFVFKRRAIRGDKVLWVPALDISEAFGKEPTEIDIILLNDNPNKVFRSKRAWWTAQELRCWGELVQIANGSTMTYEMQATRRTPEHPEGEPWPAGQKYLDGPNEGRLIESCGDECPEKLSCECQVSGDLYFMLERFPHLGAICTLHTSSGNSVRNLSSAFEQYHAIFGSLKWIRARLKVTPKRGPYPDRETREFKWGTYPILSVELGVTNLERFLGTRTQSAQAAVSEHAFSHDSPGVVVRDDAKERAAEIFGEFYRPKQSRRVVKEAVVPVEDEERYAFLCDRARRVGFNEAKWRMLWGQCRGNLDEIERRLPSQSNNGREPKVSGDRAKNNGHHAPEEAKLSANKTGPVATTEPKPLPTSGLLFAETGASNVCDECTNRVLPRVNICD